MMDGVVLTDHGMLDDFDAMLIDDVYIYPQTVMIGGIPFNGVVNFVTKNNHVAGLHFPPNVRVMDFKGVSYPVCYTGGRPTGNEDLRQVLFWHPLSKPRPERKTRSNWKCPATKESSKRSPKAGSAAASPSGRNILSKYNEVFLTAGHAPERGRSEGPV